MSKFTLNADTIEQLTEQFMAAVRNHATLELKENSKGTGQYAIWKHETPGKPFTLKAGVPMTVETTVVFKGLTDQANYDAKQAQRKAATLQRFEALQAQMRREGIELPK